MPREKNQFATRAEAQAEQDAINVRHGLEARRAYDIARMSRYIRPEHYEQCITQTLVDVIADGDGTFLLDVHEAEDATKPTKSTRVVLTDNENGTTTKIVKLDQPVEAVAK